MFFSDICELKLLLQADARKALIKIKPVLLQKLKVIKHFSVIEQFITLLTLID